MYREKNSDLVQYNNGERQSYRIDDNVYNHILKKHFNRPYYITFQSFIKKGEEAHE